MTILMYSHLIIQACLYSCEYFVYKILFPTFLLKLYQAFLCFMDLYHFHSLYNS